MCAKGKLMWLILQETIKSEPVEKKEDFKMEFLLKVFDHMSIYLPINLQTLNTLPINSK